MSDALQYIESLVKISNKLDHFTVGFFCTELETRIKILLKLPTAFYFQDRKLLRQFSAQEFYLLDKSNNQIWSFDLLACSKKIHQIFCAEWETRV